MSSNFKITGFAASLLFLANSTSAQNQSPILLDNVDLSEFSLVYDVNGQLTGDHAGTWKSSYSISQKGGKLFIREQGGSQPFWFLFDGKRSYYEYHPRGVTSVNGLATNLIASSVVLPFNTSLWKLYYPPERLKSFAEKVIRSPRYNEGIRRVAKMFEECGANTAYLGGSDADPDATYFPATVSRTLDRIVLNLGVPGKLVASYSFSKFQPLGTARVPGTISIAIPQSKSSRLLMTCTLRDTSLHSMDIPKVESLLTPQMLVSYSESGVPKAGVFYNPREGSFEDQLKEQMRRRKYPDTPKAN